MAVDDDELVFLVPSATRTVLGANGTGGVSSNISFLDRSIARSNSISSRRSEDGFVLFVVSGRAVTEVEGEDGGETPPLSLRGLGWTKGADAYVGDGPTEP